jgi:hypothetical protein
VSWDVVRYRDTSDVHVVPVNDTREHMDIRQCWCRPTLDEEAGHVVVVHQSADGREYFEPDHGEDTTVERPS